MTGGRCKDDVQRLEWLVHAYIVWIRMYVHVHTHSNEHLVHLFGNDVTSNFHIHRQRTWGNSCSWRQPEQK